MSLDGNETESGSEKTASVPADLLIVIMITVLTGIVSVVPAIRTTPVRWVSGFVFVAIVPGWALVAALFPSSGKIAQLQEHSIWGGAVGPLSLLERVALSIGVSLASLGLISVVLGETPWGIGFTTVLPAATVYTMFMAVVALFRRQNLSAEQRFRLPIGRPSKDIARPKLDVSTLVSVLFISCLLITMGSVGYALTTPSPTERFTELYLLTEDESGELKADNYPTDLTVGKSTTIQIGITNRESKLETYTVVGVIQNATVANNQTRVTDQRVLTTFQQSIKSGDTHIRSVEISPKVPSEQRRLTFMLYRGNAPENPTTDTAYKTTHIWVSVTRS